MTSGVHSASLSPWGPLALPVVAARGHVMDYVVLEKGRVESKKGAVYIIIDHFGTQKDDVTASEILSIGEIIRSTVPVVGAGGKHLYETLGAGGERLRVVVGKNGNREVVITFYSNRKSGGRLGRGHNASLGTSPIQTRTSALDDKVSQSSGEVNPEGSSDSDATNPNIRYSIASNETGPMSLDNLDEPGGMVPEDHTSV